MKLQIYDNFLGWLTVTGKSEEEVRKEAELCEVMYKVDGVLKSWKQ